MAMRLLVRGPDFGPGRRRRSAGAQDAAASDTRVMPARSSTRAPASPATDRTSIQMAAPKPGEAEERAVATVHGDMESAELGDSNLWSDGPPYELFKEARSKCPVHW